MELHKYEIDRGWLRIVALGVCLFFLTVPGNADRPVAPGYNSPAPTKYLLDSSQSKFIAHAYAGGLLWFKGHDHYVAAREFGGEAVFTPENIPSSSLHLVVKSDSLAETGAVFTEPQKQIINKELREIVLLPSQYPEIVFTSSSVSGTMANGTYNLKITGDLTLHGTTHKIVIPTQVTVSGNDLRAVGEFHIDRHDYNVKATSVYHGLVSVRNKLKFTFDIVGHRS